MSEPIGRCERKFVTSSDVASAVREEVRAHLKLDEHMPPDADRGYTVHSLYFDTPSLDLYRQSRKKQKERYKLRIRFYDSEPSSQAFVEVKERSAGQVFKLRCAADKPLVESMLADARSESVEHALSNGGRDTALEEFCKRRALLNAAPKVLVSFSREAYVSDDETVRVTFDRRIRSNAFGYNSGLSVPPRGVSVDGMYVILEFKYVGERPEWMTSLMKRYGLRRASYSKFIHCMDALGITGKRRRRVKVSGHR